MVDFEDVVKKIQKRIESGLLFMGSAFVTDYIAERLARRHLKEYAELAVGTGSALAADMLGLTRYLGGFDVYAEYLLDGMSDYGMMKSLYHFKFRKAPLCFFTDANTIVCKNFDADVVDANTVKVYINDVAATISTVSGSPSEFTISLASPAASGWAKLMVTAGDAKKDAFRGRVYIP